MPRILILNPSATVLLPTGPSSGTALNQTFTAADVSSGNYFVASGRDLVTVYNSDSVDHHLSVNSAPDISGRKADIASYTVLAGGFVEFLVMPTSLYTQTDGTVQLNADNALIKFLIRSL